MLLLYGNCLIMCLCRLFPTLCLAQGDDLLFYTVHGIKTYLCSGLESCSEVWDVLAQMRLTPLARQGAAEGLRGEMMSVKTL